MVDLDMAQGYKGRPQPTLATGGGSEPSSTSSPASSAASDVMCATVDYRVSPSPSVGAVQSLRATCLAASWKSLSVVSRV